MPVSSKQLSCCLCGEASTSTSWKMVDDIQLLKCTQCGLIHLAEIVASPEAFLDDVNSGDNTGKLEYWGYPEFFTNHRKVFDQFFDERFSRIKNACPPTGKWLDVGSGYGLWQDYLNHRAQENFGLEIEKQAFLYAQSLGIDLNHQSIENYISTERFAVITMCDVLEHVEEPLFVLSKCHELLKPGGLLYLQVPDVVGLKYPFGDSMGVPHHLWQFNVSTLRGLINKVGFLEVEHWTGIQGVIKYYEQGGPSWWRKLSWQLARYLRRGNRLQLLVKK